VNLPIIKFSVDWWNTLHQPASVIRLGGPMIAVSMLVPLLVMATGFLLLFLTLLMLRMRAALNERKASALRFNTVLVRARAAAAGRRVRRGGLVQPDRLVHDAGGRQVTFRATDGAADLGVVYEGIPPDLFREGQGVVAEGKLRPDGVFAATTVLAKHDERYM